MATVTSAHCAISSTVTESMLTKSLGPFATELLMSGLSVGVATACTNPVDVVKVRLQVTRPDGRVLGLIGTGVDLVRTEGPVALFNGVTPAVARAVFYGGLRLGLYCPVKDALTTEGQNATITQKIAAGCISGGLAAGISNPTDLVKTRLQTKGSQYTSSSQVIRHIIASDGVAGLWKGTVPSMARAAALTASQCVTYDVMKRQVLAYSGGEETTAVHALSSMLTGLVSTTITSPVDVIKTRMFIAGGGVTGPVQCAVDIWARDGVAGFFKGWTANYARLGPQTMITFMVVEQLRSLTGLKSM